MAPAAAFTFTGLRTQLVYNSILSWVTGWYYLIACEIIAAGPAHYVLPGLGSYLMTASDKGRTGEIIAGIARAARNHHRNGRDRLAAVINLGREVPLRVCCQLGTDCRSWHVGGTRALGPSDFAPAADDLSTLFQPCSQCVRDRSPFFDPRQYPALRSFSNIARILALTVLTFFCSLRRD